VFFRYALSKVKDVETIIFQDDFESQAVGTFPSLPGQMCLGEGGEQE
jgi:hypothetical protein